jgi:hypothetical protein
VPALEYAQLAAELARTISEKSGEAWAMLYVGHAYLLQNELDVAKEAYRRSSEIRKELGQPSLSMEPIAGLVEAYMLADDLEGAAHEAEKIMSFLESGSTLDGTEEPLQTAVNMLEAQVAKLGDENARKRYVENIPWRRALRDGAKRSFD